MKFQVVTVLPQMIKDGLGSGVIGSAFKRQLIKVETHNPRSVSTDFHKTIDDRPFGGGDGMVLLPETLSLITLSILKESMVTPQRQITVLLSPQGQIWKSESAELFATKYDEIILICGRYAGVDQRFINEFVDLEVSLGDYVVSGGELPALILIDSIARFLPGVLGHEKSVFLDSFNDGLLEAPLFTRPRLWKNQNVPDILCSGDHSEIQKWKTTCSWLVTLKKRPDLFENKFFSLSKLDRCMLTNKLKDFLQNLSNEDKENLDFGGLIILLEKYNDL